MLEKIVLYFVHVSQAYLISETGDHWSTAPAKNTAQYTEETIREATFRLPNGWSVSTADDSAPIIYDETGREASLVTENNHPVVVGYASGRLTSVALREAA